MGLTGRDARISFVDDLSMGQRYALLRQLVSVVAREYPHQEIVWSLRQALTWGSHVLQLQIGLKNWEPSTKTGSVDWYVDEYPDANLYTMCAWKQIL